MGNSIGGKRRAKVMKIDGSVVKLKPPAAARDVLRDHPGHVLLESEQVKQLGLRAKPLDPDLPLKPNRLYFLVDLPKLPVPAPPHPRGQMGARRVRSGINMSAKDRLESLMLSRRTVSDLSFARSAVGGGGGGEVGEDGAAVRVRVRLPKDQVARLVEESEDAADAAEKIMELCVGGGQEDGGAGELPALWKPVTGIVRDKKEKRMRFALTEDRVIG